MTRADGASWHRVGSLLLGYRQQQRDDDERQRREPMPIAACHLNKVRRMWGRCTGVQACSR